MDLIKNHLLGLPIAAVLGAFGLYLLQSIRLAFIGSRRGSGNWKKKMEVFGDIFLLKLGIKRINPDTIDTEGDAASIYYEEFRAPHYEIIGHWRVCYIRTFVGGTKAFYQWPTVRKLGDSLMNQYDVIYPGMKLEEKVDAKGNAYSVKVLALDIPHPEGDQYLGKYFAPPTPVTDVVPAANAS